MSYNKKNKKGFTLMELLVTVILVSILASYGVYFYTDIMNEAKLKASKGKLAALGGATARFITENAPELTCLNGLDINQDISTFLGDNTRQCVGKTNENKWNMYNVFACGYAEKNLGVDENFEFYFGCPSNYSCGSFSQMTVYMKPKTGAPSSFPVCAYFDPDSDKVVEVE